MAYTIKEKFARIDLNKVPDELKTEINEIKELTSDFNDKDAVDMAEENFNLLYGIIEDSYPDALKIKSKIKAPKPTKKKVAKKKAKKLTEGDIEVIEETLTNDEGSTDEEMIEYLQSELGLNENQAKRWVNKRDQYLRNAGDMTKTAKYSLRKRAKKDLRKDKNRVKTLDNKVLDRTDPKLKGHKFYDENGKEYTCVRYSAKMDECIMKDKDGKEIVSCLRDMYYSKPEKKKEPAKKDDKKKESKESDKSMVEECRTVLKDAGYKLVKQKAGKKVYKRKKPRQERTIITERVNETFTPVMKDISGSEEKDEKFKDTIKILENIRKKLAKLINRLNNLAEDNDTDKIKKIDKLLDEILPD